MFLNCFIILYRIVLTSNKIKYKYSINNIKYLYNKEKFTTTWQDEVQTDIHKLVDELYFLSIPDETTDKFNLLFNGKHNIDNTNYNYTVYFPR